MPGSAWRARGVITSVGEVDVNLTVEQLVEWVALQPAVTGSLTGC
jgi:hypothetical protein